MECGLSRKDGKREREKQIKRVRDRAQERIRNDFGLEMTIGKGT
jgi:hypothetical protein